MKQVNDRSHVRPISVADRFRTDLHHRSTLINELYFLHQRTASLMSSIATRETHRPLRDLLQDQTVVDQYIAGRLRSVASEHGMPPSPSANLSSTETGVDEFDATKIRYCSLPRVATASKSNLTAAGGVAGFRATAYMTLRAVSRTTFSRTPLLSARGVLP